MGGSMNNHPFSTSIADQLASIREGVAILERFAEKYGDDLKPFSCSPLGPSLYFSSSDILTCRDRFGAEGWEQHTHSISKTVDGCVRVEVQMPKEYHPFQFPPA